ncbi:MAG: hypothetical protein E7318_04320 [Clostridiales bacterium]|nr:hypothetical protein [Clostridiales bacterium]
MKKRLMLALMLILCAVLLASCGETKRYDVLSTNDGGNQQNPALTEADTYDPRVEEDSWTAPVLPTQAPVTPTPAPTVRSEYAGATPVVIDPIDKPTPTAVPALGTITYTAYDAIKVGLSFEGPAGWLKDDTAADTFIIQNPNARIDYPATLTLRSETVSRDYTSSDLKSVINSMLSAIGNAGFEDYEPSQTANRDLLGKSGVYANYSGTLEDSREVSGRVHAVCVDRVLYTIHLTAPKAQWNDYKDKVYDHLRDTLTIIK